MHAEHNLPIDRFVLGACSWQLKTVLDPDFNTLQNKSVPERVCGVGTAVAALCRAVPLTGLWCKLVPGDVQVETATDPPPLITPLCNHEVCSILLMRGDECAACTGSAVKLGLR